MSRRATWRHSKHQCFAKMGLNKARFISWKSRLLGIFSEVCQKETNKNEMKIQPGLMPKDSLN